MQPPGLIMWCFYHALGLASSVFLHKKNPLAPASTWPEGGSWEAGQGIKIVGLFRKNGLRGGALSFHADILSHQHSSGRGAGGDILRGIPFVGHPCGQADNSQDASNAVVLCH